MLQVEDASFSYGENAVLERIDLRIDDGEFVGIVGRNGAGKTTLLKLITGLIKPQVGKVTNTFERSAFIAQVTGSNDLVFPATVGEVVSLGLKFRPFSFMRRSDWRRVDQALEIMGVSDLKNRSISSLSGGQQQRVRLAKALISDPDILVMDEPTTGMDAESRSEFLRQTARLHRELGKTIVLVTHFISDLDDADRILFLNDSRIEPYDPERARGGSALPKEER